MIHSLDEGGISMYVGRDLLELAMIETENWSDHELHFFHEQMTHLASYLNEDGVGIHQRVIHEMISRNQLQMTEPAFLNSQNKLTYE